MEQTDENYGFIACLFWKMAIFADQKEQLKMELTFDKTDLDILRELSKDSRLSVRELAARVHRTSTPVFERLKRLEQNGVIKGYTVILDREKLGRGFTVFCNVKLARINTEIHEAFALAMGEMEEVKACYNVSGAFDYLLRVQVADMRAYRRFVTEQLGLLEMVETVQSVFVMETIKEEQ